MNDKMREEFETELSRQGVKCVRRVYGEEAELYGLEDGDYFGLEARSGWHFWQASREAIVIELPENLYWRSATETRDMCADRIRAAGLKAKTITAKAVDIQDA